MRNRMCLAVSVLVVMAFALDLAALPVGVGLSGYEFLLGTSCTIGGNPPGKCGVQFGGWTGLTGSGGWRAFPGNEEGLWKATINYSGAPDFGESVNVLSGSFDLLFVTGKNVSGQVTSGTVTWPVEGLGVTCGPDGGRVSLILKVAGGTGYFNGCLHDIPAGSVIPPTIWGTLTLP